MKRKPIINIHCHLFNFDFIPDKMIKLLAKIPEKIADDKWFSVTAGVLVAILPGVKYDRIQKYLKTYRSNLDNVTKEYIKEMGNAGIDICVPLMMDFEKTVLNIEPENIDYETQIEIISKQVAKYPWRIFPFVMFDPRRNNSFELCKKALENKGFIGIKMYPALGYYPSPHVMEKKGNQIAADNLRNLYEYCKKKKIPITTHASTGGAYSTKSDINREKNVWPLTEVSNWIDPIRDYNLKINFAHFGGNYLNIKDAKRLQSVTWRREILNLIARSRNEKGFGKIFSDLSYHDMALKKNTKRNYFDDLNEVLGSKEQGQGILFGTDASMISHTWSEKDFIKPFKNQNNLKSSFQEIIFSNNPIDFLFENAKIPNSYCKFIKSNATPDKLSSLPEWVEMKNNKYFIVT